MKKILLLSSVAILSIHVAVAVEIRTEPTFHSCGLYIPSERADSCCVEYGCISDSSQWNKAFTPYLDTLNHEFRISLVRLRSAETYQVRCIRYRGLDKDTLYATFSTWTDNPPISRRIKLSSFPKQKDGSVVIRDVHGSLNGWIIIEGDKPIRAQSQNEAAVLLQNCSYLIFDKVKVTGGRLHGVKTLADVFDVRFMNCDISHWGRKGVVQDSVGHYLDSDGKEINNDAGLCIYKSRNIVLERSYIHDPNGCTNTWNGKIACGPLRGKTFIFSHPQGPNAVYVMQTGGGIVLRYNVLVGSQSHRYNDPIEAWQNKAVNGGFAHDADIYGNMIAFGQDDALELDGGQCNVRVFDNRMEQTYCGISTAPNRKGPCYIFNNVLYNMANSDGKTGNAIKNGGGDTFTRGVQYLFNNTIVFAGGGMAGVGYGKDPNRALFFAYTRNNILYSFCADNSTDRSGYCIYDPWKAMESDFDYDLLANRCNKSGRGSIKAKEGSELHGIYGEPLFTNLQQGVFTLRDQSRGVGQGQVIANFSPSDATNIGAFEQGESSLCPKQPLPLEANRYNLTFIDNRTQYITLQVGDYRGELEVAMAEDMKPWLDVRCSTNKVSPFTPITIAIRIKKQMPYTMNGVLVLRTQDGYFIPITINYKS